MPTFCPNIFSWDALTGKFDFFLAPCLLTLFGDPGPWRPFRGVGLAVKKKKKKSVSFHQYWAGVSRQGYNILTDCGSVSAVFRVGSLQLHAFSSSSLQ